MMRSGLEHDLFWPGECSLKKTCREGDFPQVEIEVNPEGDQNLIQKYEQMNLRNASTCQRQPNL